MKGFLQSIIPGKDTNPRDREATSELFTITLQVQQMLNDVMQQNGVCGGISIVFRDNPKDKYIICRKNKTIKVKGS